MEERMRFIARLLDDEKMAPLCREFGISRKTGYKLFNRYKDCGLDALTDRSRRPYRQANQLPMQIEKLIVGLKKEYPHWGAPKIREKLRRLYPDIHCPAISTVHAVLDRHGLVKRRKRRRNKACGTALALSTGATGSLHISEVKLTAPSEGADGALRLATPDAVDRPGFETALGKRCLHGANSRLVRGKHRLGSLAMEPA